MSKATITIEMLNDGTPGQILAKGECFDNEDGLNMTTSHKRLRWVAKIGAVGDWAVYTHWATNDWFFIMDQGDKVIAKYNLENILSFSEEVFKRYRK
ncbi:MAG: hypothetical protein ABIP51_11700 [Bacteroidia bacterium]